MVAFTSRLRDRRPKGRELMEKKCAGGRTREDRRTGRLRGRYCFVHSTHPVFNYAIPPPPPPLNYGMSGCQSYPIRITRLLSRQSL